jgi:microcystin-dependent protein
MEAFIGTIMPWAGNYVPQGWLACDGATYSFMQQSQFQALYAVIGNTYGGSPAEQTFAVPDLRGRVPMGAGNALRPGTVTTLSVGTGTDQLPALAVNYIICYNGLFPMRDD